MYANRRKPSNLLATLALMGCCAGAGSIASTAVLAAEPAAGIAAASTNTPAASTDTSASVPSAPMFEAAELDQMMAPLALYPDSLLAQVLMASTYPGNVADAAAWSKAHPDVSGDEAVAQVANEDWDPSVQSLVAFPAVLATLGQDPAWVQKVGDAFLAQPDAVMDSVQRLRGQAKEAGNLESNEQQKVSVEPTAAPLSNVANANTTVQQAPAQTIIIEPADPQVVYVPSYNPNEVYGTWRYPSYPPTYYPPPSGYYFGQALMRGLAFGTGIAIVNSLWGDCDWRDRDVDIDVHRYNNININRRLDINDNRWRHNPRYRDGVPYRDHINRQRYERRLDGGAARDALRGHDPARADARARAREAMNKHGIQGGQGNARERVQQLDRERARDSLKQHGINAGQQGNLRERAQQVDRDRAKQRLEQHAGQKPAINRDQAREKAHALSNNPQLRQKAQNSPKVRDAVRKQQARQPRTRDNAFAGARHPAKARQQINRGNVSRAAAQRPKASRPAGHAVQRAPRNLGGGGLKRH